MIANLEVQKIGYDFPGQRAACYSADLLLRQYKRVRDRRKDAFTYRDVCPVYVIVLFEKSQAIFHAFPDTYIHRVKPESDTGLSIELLQNYIFIHLDIFKEKTQNGIISNKLEAWLTFFTMKVNESSSKSEDECYFHVYAVHLSNTSQRRSMRLVHHRLVRKRGLIPCRMAGWVCTGIIQQSKHWGQPLIPAGLRSECADLLDSCDHSYFTTIVPLYPVFSTAAFTFRFFTVIVHFFGSPLNAFFAKIFFPA